MLHGAVAALIILLILGAVVLGILGTIFWIWMVIDCATNKKLRDDQKVIWLLVIIFTHLIGAIIYYFAGRTPQAGQAQESYQMYTQRHQQSYQPYQQQPYQSYQQGYQPQQAPPPTPQASEQQYRQEQPRGEQPQYEQLQVSYPEDSAESRMQRQDLP
jgi:glucan phosphoethanolaminetransferase (alkaline phosphatase superfamily)